MQSKYYTCGSNAFNARYYQLKEEVPATIIGSFKNLYSLPGLHTHPLNLFNVNEETIS